MTLEMNLSLGQVTEGECTRPSGPMYLPKIGGLTILHILVLNLALLLAQLARPEVVRPLRLQIPALVDIFGKR